MHSTRYTLAVIAAGFTATILTGCGGDGGEITTPTGSLEIRTTTSGEVLGDYRIGVDGGAPSSIGANAVSTVTDVEAGPHLIELSGLPAGCTVNGENPRTVSVSAGANTLVEFAVSCTRPVGTIQVTATTTGPAPAGYELLVDGVAQGPIGANAVRSLPDIPQGQHAVGFGGIPANCQLEGQNPQAVTLAPGATVEISFVLACTAPPAESGSLTITTTTTGSDPDGFRVVTDGGTPQPIALTGTLTLPNVAVGSHTVRLAGLAPNCTVSGPNPRTVSVSAGMTATVAFVIQCSPTTGSLRIIVATAGSNPDLDGYTFTVDNGTPQPIAPSGTATVPDLAQGAHTVALSGLAGNCSVPNAAQTVTVPGGATVDVTFTVTCSAATPQWTRMESGTEYSLIDVWGSGAADVVAVGERGSGFHGGIFHYDGRAWQQTYSEDGLIPHAVWGSGATDVFAVGTDPLVMFGYDGLILHFDGAAWTRMNGPGVGTENGPRQASFRGVWGSSPTDVYAVGNVFDQIGHALIARYDGTRWTAVPLTTTDNRFLEDVHGTSASDIYAVGSIDLSQSLRRGTPSSSLRASRREGSVGLILHYDGTNWTELIPAEPDVFFTGVWSVAPNDVFAVGGRGSTGAIYHYDGSSWTPMTVPATGELLEVWGAAGNDVYAVGNRAILHYDGSVWTAVQSVPERLAGVWGNNPADVFAVGSRGAIYHGPPPVATTSR